MQGQAALHATRAALPRLRGGRGGVEKHLDHGRRQLKAQCKLEGGDLVATVGDVLLADRLDLRGG